jgi:hypothetical protein
MKDASRCALSRSIGKVSKWPTLSRIVAISQYWPIELKSIDHGQYVVAQSVCRVVGTSRNRFAGNTEASPIVGPHTFCAGQIAETVYGLSAAAHLTEPVVPANVSPFGIPPCSEDAA